MTLAGQVIPSTAKKTETAGSWTYFVIRRGAFLIGALHTNWAPDGQDLKNRLTAEIQAIKTFLDAELGTAGQAQLDVRAADAPQHLNLADAVRFRTSLAANSAVVTSGLRREKRRRDLLVQKIVLRALAIESALWDDNAVFDTAALREILDRRLRVAERMNLNVAGMQANADDIAGTANWDVSNATASSGWRDGFRTRLFEYPTITRNTDTLVKRLTNAGVTLSMTEGEAPPPYVEAETWVEFVETDANNVTTVKQLTWNVEPPRAPAGPPVRAAMNVRIPAGLLADNLAVWVLGSYNVIYVRATGGGGKPFSEVLDEVFRLRDSNGNDVKLDLWSRTWMYCDHVVAALHIEALLFGRRRRLGVQDADQELNDLVDGEPLGYAGLAAMLRFGGTSDGLVDGRQGNKHFVTREKLLDDLEIGDQIVYWNSDVYDVLSNGAWRLENAVVVDVDADPKSGVLDPKKLVVAGHGETAKPHADMLAEFTKMIRDDIKDARDAIVAAQTGNPTVDTVTLHKGSAVRWAPYEEPLDTTLKFHRDEKLRETDLPAGATLKGMWWVVVSVPSGTVTDWVVRTAGALGVGMQIYTGQSPGADGSQRRVLVSIPKNAALRPFPAALDPDRTILFPLLEPTVTSAGGNKAWHTYLQARAGGGAMGSVARPKLRAVAIDSFHIPGLDSEGTGLIWSTHPRVHL